MGRRTDSRRAIAERARTRACVSDKAIQRSRGYGGMNHNEVRRRPHHADHGKIGRRIIRQVPIQALVDGLCAIGADEQRMTIALRARRFRGSEIAASTRLVLDHNRLPKHGLQVPGQQPCREIGASSRRKRYKDGNCLAGPNIGRGFRPTGNRHSAGGGGASQNQVATSQRHYAFLQAWRAAMLWR